LLLLKRRILDLLRPFSCFLICSRSGGTDSVCVGSETTAVSDYGGKLGKGGDRFATAATANGTSCVNHWGCEEDFAF
jgi:hypothetical protein